MTKAKAKTAPLPTTNPSMQVRLTLTQISYLRMLVQDQQDDALDGARNFKFDPRAPAEGAQRLAELALHCDLLDALPDIED